MVAHTLTAAPEEQKPVSLCEFKSDLGYPDSSKSIKKKKESHVKISVDYCMFHI